MVNYGLIMKKVEWLYIFYDDLSKNPLFFYQTRLRI